MLDNAATHKTPAIQKWLAGHPRFVLHFTPTSSSWLNLVERWFAELTNKKLRRGTHRSVRDPNTDIRAWIQTWNDNPLPYVWTKTADEILDSIATYCTRINESRHACGSASAYVRGRNLAIVANAPGVALIAGDRRSGAAHSLRGAFVRCNPGEVGDQFGEMVGLVDHRERPRVLDHLEAGVG